MSPEVSLTLFAILIAASGVFSGSETGVYSLSVPRLEAEAAEGRWAARLLAGLVRKKSALLVALLVGNNLVLQLATHLAEREVPRILPLPPGGTELVVTLLLTPIVFFFGEVLPKDLFRRRPHRLLSFLAPLLGLARALTLPVSLPLFALSRWLERRLKVRDVDLERAFRRQEVLELLAQGTRSGTVPAPAEELARNVLSISQRPVRELSVPWERVQVADLDLPAEELRERVRHSSHTRLPAVRTGEDGRLRVVGYLHQLDVLGRVDEPPVQLVRTLPELAPDLPVDQALGRLRTSGQRIALVGTAGEPSGIVTLMDLVSTLAGRAPFRRLSATAGGG